LANSTPSKKPSSSDKVSKEIWPAILPPEGISIHIKADNNGAIGLSAGTTPHSHTKHFNRMEFNYVQKQIQLQRVLLQKIPTEDNIADIFTKPLPESKFRALPSRPRDRYLAIPCTDDTSR